MHDDQDKSSQNSEEMPGANTLQNAQKLFV